MRKLELTVRSPESANRLDSIGSIEFNLPIDPLQPPSATRSSRRTIIVGRSVANLWVLSVSEFEPTLCDIRLV